MADCPMQFCDFISLTPFAYGWYRCDQERKYLYDPERARALLEEAGWIEGPDGIRVAQGAPYAEDGTRLRVQLTAIRISSHW